MVICLTSSHRVRRSFSTYDSRDIIASGKISVQQTCLVSPAEYRVLVL